MPRPACNPFTSPAATDEKYNGNPHNNARKWSHQGSLRADLGYPIMVTPFSQFVVSQATFNVILGERYREVPDEIIPYALGRDGEEARSNIEPPSGITFWIGPGRAN